MVTLIVFFSVRFIPGDVISLMLSEMADLSIGEKEITEEVIREQLGLNVPVHIQYGRWIGIAPQAEGGFSGVLQGDFGRSMWGGWNILEEIARRFPVTLELCILAMTIAILIALPIGTYSAIRQDTTGDYIGRSVAILFISLPVFWTGTMVTVYPSLWWGWSPPIHYTPLTEDVLGNLAHVLLPATLQGMFSSGSIMRMSRTMMLEVLRQDYIRTAWAKGLRERTIIYRHALKNALIPVVTLAGTLLPYLLGGSVIVEQIFNLPGIARLMLESLGKRDYPIVSAINVIVASLVLVVNLLIDLSYAYLDPRVVYK